MKLKNKKIIVTGGSRGIGAGIVRALDREGAQVVFTYGKQASLAEKLLSQLSGRHRIFGVDLKSEASVEKTMGDAIDSLGGLDGLVNNAGITKDNLVLRMKSEEFDEVIQTNLKGTFLCTKLALRPMLKARAGSIVSVTSVVGHIGNPGQSNYCASKAGIEAFSKSVALEVASRNIRLNCVAPGFIETDMTAALTEDQKKALLSQVPIPRMGTVDDVAAAVLFLLSDESTYITGHTINVNGGLER